MPVVQFGSAPSPQDRQAAMQAIVSLMDRLAEVLQEENAVLESAAPANHDGFVARKNQLLRDLIILQRNIGTVSVSDSVAARLRQVRTLVERNNHLLKLQVDAMFSVTSLLTEAALAEDADGTYTRAQQ